MQQHDFAQTALNGLFGLLWLGPLNHIVWGRTIFGLEHWFPGPSWRAVFSRVAVDQVTNMPLNMVGLLGMATSFARRPERRARQYWAEFLAFLLLCTVDMAFCASALLSLRALGASAAGAQRVQRRRLLVGDMGAGARAARRPRFRWRTATQALIDSSRRCGGMNRINRFPPTLEDGPCMCACVRVGPRCRLMRSGGLLWKLLQLGCFSFKEFSA